MAVFERYEIFLDEIALLSLLHTPSRGLASRKRSFERISYEHLET